jgi:hypothetical protein
VWQITVTECGDRIQAVQAKMRSISAYQSANLTFALYSLTNLGFNTGCNGTPPYHSSFTICS